MKILLLNQYYPPDTSATAKMAYGAVEFVSGFHQVTVLCGRPSYDPTERRPWRLYQNELTKVAKVIRTGSTEYSRFAMKKRVINYLTYTALAVPRALFVDCDIILAMTDPPYQPIVGAFVGMLKRKPYVYNIRDLYPDMAVAGSIIEPGLLAKVWEKLHRWALRRAARVIVLGDDMRARIIAKSVDPEHVVVVRDGAEIPTSDATAPTVDPEVVRTIRGNFSFVLVHAGNLGFYGAWNTLVTAARRLSNDGVGLVFVGEGAQREEIRVMAAGAENIRFLDFFPSSKIPSVLAAADAHVITIKTGLEGVVVPSKMYGILVAGKPILALANKETDVATLAVQRGFGVAANPDDPEGVIKAIREMAFDRNKLKSMAEAAKAAAPDYDRVNEMKKFVAILDGLVAAE